MLRAALASRSWTVPHAEQTQARTFSGLGPSRCPHAEQVWEVGAHGEVLDGDRLVLADQPQGKLVMVVGALVADPTVGDRDPQACFRPVLGSLLLAAELPLRAGQAPLSGPQEPRVGEGLDGAVAGGDRGE